MDGRRSLRGCTHVRSTVANVFVCNPPFRGSDVHECAGEGRAHLRNHPSRCTLPLLHSMLISVIQRVALAGWAVATLGACSFGYQSIYEGDVRFEHCYRLDEETLTPIAEKQQCWAEWTRRSTYGQTRDRISYALARERALAAHGSATAPPVRPSIELRKPTNASPQPTNAFAPPPQMLVELNDGGSRPGADARLGLVAAVRVQPGAPGEACAGVCAGDRGTCSGACQGDACLSRCDERYRACMRSCF